MASPNSAYFKDLADKLWRQLVLSSGRCLLRGMGPCQGGLQAHHLVGRGRRRFRHDLQNGVALCAGHHHKATTEPIWFRGCLLVRRPDLAKWKDANKYLMGRVETYSEAAGRLKGMLE